MVDVPVVFMLKESHEFRVAELQQVQALHGLAVFVGDSVNPARILLVDGSAANVGVVPVDHPDASFGSRVHVEAKEVFVVSHHEVSPVSSLESRTIGFEIVHV